MPFPNNKLKFSGKKHSGNNPIECIWKEEANNNNNKNDAQTHKRNHTEMKTEEH